MTMYDKTTQKDYVKVAVTLSRLYGIAETLHPLGYLSNEKFIEKIEKWTDEFLSMKNTEKDILKFFESRIGK